MENRGSEFRRVRAKGYADVDVEQRAARNAREVRRSGAVSGLGRLAAQTLIYTGGMLALLLLASRLMSG